MRGWWKMVALLGLMLLPSCAGDGDAGSFCAAARPVYVGPEDVFSAETARALLAHNETGARLCGWQGR